MASKSGSAPAETLTVGERTVRISHPDRVYFPERGETKIDLAHYYLSVGDGIVRALRERRGGSIWTRCRSVRSIGSGAVPACGTRCSMSWVERRAPRDVTTTWSRKDRDPTACFVDYDQNSRDHTIASAYSVRGNPRGTVSTPIEWDEITDAAARNPPSGVDTCAPLER